MMRRSVAPEAMASSTTQWIAGLSTTGSISFGCSFVRGRKRLPDFSDFESIAENPFRRAQLSHIQAWIRGATLDVGSNFGRLSALSASTVSLDVGRRWLLRGIELGNITRGVVGSALALPFNDGCFDTVLAIGITEHIPLPSMSRLLDELSRV